MAHSLTVPGAQVTKAERIRITELSAKVSASKEKPIMVNIGIMWGCTLWCLRDGSASAEIYGLDIAPSKWSIADVGLLRAKILQGDSRTYAFELPIDLLLIDGDHHYETVKADIENWIHRIAPGGILIFHDYAPTALNLRQFPELEGVKRAVDSWFKTQVGWTEIKAPDSLRAFRLGL